MLRLVSVASKIDPGRGFDDLKAAVAVLNASVLPHQWGTYEAVISKSTGKMFMPLVHGTRVAQVWTGIRTACQLDLGRTLMLVQGIQSKAASALAQRAICRAILAPSNSPR